MSKVDFSWVDEQMAGAKVRIPVGKLTVALLKAWDGIATDSLTPAQIEEGLTLFKHLAQSHSVLEPYKDEIWVDARPGDLKVADLIRVKSDAFTGDQGVRLNGRRGKIVGIRYGDIVFRSDDDRKPLLDGVHLPPSKLEKRVV
jgi:hypothetical protein